MSYKKLFIFLCAVLFGLNFGYLNANTKTSDTKNIELKSDFFNNFIAPQDTVTINEEQIQKEDSQHYLRY